jgi:toxin secretion/phage lysis holin
MEKTKISLVAAVAGANAFLGNLAIPVYLLVALNITDYVTGIVAARYRGEAVSSDIGFRGIAKKISMWLLVGLGAAMDWLLAYTTDTVGISLPFTCLVASLAAVWLIANEIISIVENIADIGAPLPPFLMKLAKMIKAGAEQASEAKGGGSNGDHLA